MNFEHILQQSHDRLPQMLADIERVINIETPSSDKEAVKRGAQDFATLMIERLGATPELVEIDGVTHVRLRFGDGARKVILVNHQDTVWPHGTLDRLPFSNKDGVLRGPGVFDMITGAIMSVHATALLQENGTDLDGLTILVTGDEEVGSTTSADFIVNEAKGAAAAFVLEASQHGALKVERKGSSIYTVNVHGKAAHAGLEPEKGINAGLELAHQMQVIAGFADAGAGTTVTPTVFSGGTTTNTVPAFATVNVDVRAKTTEEQERVDALMRGLTPSVEGARIELIGGINRPPMERNMAQGLFDRAVELAEKLGIETPTAVAVGGGSDGNFTAGAGVPTLDGLGAVGDGAHAEHEHALVDQIAPRTALLAALIADQLA
ncbi:M20 family metallopeptidase [Brevibacterium sp. UMB1308A]|uniref:M20 family metallopeptidase n=1 Tax=Brevibacterium sp. UMB1308A TaxID=3050608 RepID=UPI002549F55A|nr:M20 family metallopeptidase [Brevibacterium sp. UMB1308A]MDK8347659.1 M20 family metallopeptidase [Brevibacterium sp. UMB1308B]MDK8713013.1 M20 family metallopeptidase [Brevibacterium sp. UMB1308A]